MIEGELDPATHRLFGEARRDRSPGGDHACASLGLGQRIRDDSAHQTPGERRSSSDGVIGEAELECAAATDRPAKALKAAGDGEGGSVGIEDGETGIGAGDPNVGAESQLQAPADDIAFQGGDDRLGQGSERSKGIADQRLGGSGPPARPGAAIGGQKEDARPFLRAGLRERLAGRGKVGDEISIERPAERQAGDGTVMRDRTAQHREGILAPCRGRALTHALPCRRFSRDGVPPCPISTAISSCKSVATGPCS